MYNFGDVVEAVLDGKKLIGRICNVGNESESGKYVEFEEGFRFVSHNDMELVEEKPLDKFNPNVPHCLTEDYEEHKADTMVVIVEDESPTMTTVLTDNEKLSVPRHIIQELDESKEVINLIAKHTLNHLYPMEKNAIPFRHKDGTPSMGVMVLKGGDVYLYDVISKKSVREFETIEETNYKDILGRTIHYNQLLEVAEVISGLPTIINVYIDNDDKLRSVIFDEYGQVEIDLTEDMKSRILNNMSERCVIALGAERRSMVMDAVFNEFEENYDDFD